MANVNLPGAASSLHFPSTKCPRFHVPRFPSHLRIHCAASEERMVSTGSCPSHKEMKNVALGMIAAWAVTAATPVVAVNQSYGVSKLSTPSNVTWTAE